MWNFNAIREAKARYNAARIKHYLRDLDRLLERLHNNGWRGKRDIIKLKRYCRLLYSQNVLNGAIDLIDEVNNLKGLLEEHGQDND